MKNINAKTIERFLDNYEFDGISAADMVYEMHANKEFSLMLNKVAEQMENASEEEKLLYEKIKASDKPEELVNFMRKPLNLSTKELLMKKLMKNEESVIPLIKEKCFRNAHDIFIENAVAFFIRCKTNCCKWIAENYSDFRSEYLKALICLVFGVKGDADLIPFLMDEAERFKWDYPEENFERGPLLAIEELYHRFYE